MLEGEFTRRLRRPVSFVTGASAVLVALALMAVADGGGNLPVIGRAPAHHVAGAAPNTVAPPSSRSPEETPVAEPRPNSLSTPLATFAAAAAAPSSPTELVGVDMSTPVTPPVTVPVGTNPRPDHAPATSPPAPPNQTPPKHQFGGPGIAGAHGSGRGPVGSGGAAGTKKGNNGKKGKNGDGNPSGSPSGSAAGVNPNKGNGNQNGNGGNHGKQDADRAAPSHASACNAPGKSDRARGCAHSENAPRRPNRLRKSGVRHPRAD